MCLFNTTTTKLLNSHQDECHFPYDTTWRTLNVSLECNIIWPFHTVSLYMWSVCMCVKATRLFFTTLCSPQWPSCLLPCLPSSFTSAWCLVYLLSTPATLTLSKVTPRSCDFFDCCCCCSCECLKLICVSILYFSEDRCSQNGQAKGRSCVWISMCLRTCAAFERRLKQIGQVRSSSGPPPTELTGAIELNTSESVVNTWVVLLLISNVWLDQTSFSMNTPLWPVKKYEIYGLVSDELIDWLIS